MWLNSSSGSCWRPQKVHALRGSGEDGSEYIFITRERGGARESVAPLLFARARGEKRERERERYN